MPVFMTVCAISVIRPPLGSFATSKMAAVVRSVAAMVVIGASGHNPAASVNSARIPSLPRDTLVTSLFGTDSARHGVVGWPQFCQTVNRYVKSGASIAVVSVSEFFLQIARGVLAPALGRNHTLREFFLPSEKLGLLNSFSLVFYDSVNRSQVNATNSVQYQLVANESLKLLANEMKS